MVYAAVGIGFAGNKLLPRHAVLSDCKPVFHFGPCLPSAASIFAIASEST